MASHLTSWIDRWLFQTQSGIFHQGNLLFYHFRSSHQCLRLLSFSTCEIHPHSSLSLKHNYIIHSWSICVCFHRHSPWKGLTATASPLLFLFTCSAAALDSVLGANPPKPKQILSWFDLSMLLDGWVRMNLHVSRDVVRTTVKDRSHIFIWNDFWQLNRTKTVLNDLPLPVKHVLLFVK